MITIKKGIELFNNSDFFEAHDFFEELWIESENKDRLFYQGMVQIAVGCYHTICGNFKGALSQFNKGNAKLNYYLPDYKGVNLEQLIKQVEIMIQDLNKYFSGDLFEVDLRKIPVIEYTKN